MGFIVIPANHSRVCTTISGLEAESYCGGEVVEHTGVDHKGDWRTEKGHIIITDEKLYQYAGKIIRFRIEVLSVKDKDKDGSTPKQ
jgi:hypothetical protein